MNPLHKCAKLIFLSTYYLLLFGVCVCFGFLKVYSEVLELFLEEIKIPFRLERVDVILQPKNSLFWKYRLSKNIF